MAEYIDRSEEMDIDTLQNWYIDSIDERCAPCWTVEHLEELLKDFIVIPRETPVADVRPERHGRWIDIDKQNVWGDDEPVNLFRCSACKICTETRKDHIDRYHYCPCCGAKMDGKDGESDG